MDQKIAARPLKFYHKYVTGADGQIVAQEWCDYSRPGMENMQVTPMRITEKVKQGDGWEAWKPMYDAWKNGQEMPEFGTPIGAWPRLTPEEVQAFKMAGIKSVEEIISMNDRQKSAVKLPNLEGYRNEARVFMEAKDQRVVEMKLQQQAEEIAALKALLEERLDVEAATEAPKPRRGRPPKVRDEAETEYTDEAA
jgi:hypothetical protein